MKKKVTKWEIKWNHRKKKAQKFKYKNVYFA